MDSKLKNAFRWHLQHPRRFIGAHGLQRPVGTHAIAAIMQARAWLAKRATRIPAELARQLSPEFFARLES